MTRSLTIAALVLALASGCATTREPDWRYSQPAYPPPPVCDPTQQYCPPSDCAPGQYCQPSTYPPGAYAPAPGYVPPPGYEVPPSYVPPEVYGRGDRDDHDQDDHDRREGADRRGHAVPAPPRDHRAPEHRDGDEHHEDEGR